MDAELLTTGELAGACLGNFRHILAIVDTPDAYDPALVTELAWSLVTDSLALASKLPRYARQAFAETLPLELTELHSESTDIDALKQRVAERIADWLVFKSELVEGRVVRCAEYLSALAPFLDTHDERRTAYLLQNELEF